MTRIAATRAVPITRLRKRYLRLGQRGVSTRKRREECECLIANVTPLVDEFVEALDVLRRYNRRNEPFHPDRKRRAVERRKKGATEAIGQLEGHPVSLPAPPSYVFRVVDREINPLRTTGVRSLDGGPASRKGRVGGGLDYVGLVDGVTPTPILGEIKVGSDKDAYYAFVQLLTYLSELSSKAQFARANRFLFKRRLVFPAHYDLHILLWNYNDRGQRGPVIDSTCRLVAAFKARLTPAAGTSCTLGRVLCLRKPAGAFAGALDLVWSV